MDEELQSTETSARQAAEKEKEILRAREQLETDKGAFMDERAVDCRDTSGSNITSPA